MNTNDLNARSSLTRRQRRSQAPRVECLESRELLTYPAAGVNFLIYQAVVHHQNTAFQVIAGVDNSLRNDLAGPGSPLAVLNAAGPNFTTAQANAFVVGVWRVVASYEQGAAAQLYPRFPFVYGQIFNHAQSILNGVVFHTGQFQLGNETPTQYFQTVTWLVTH
jgi:hypothetical protein